MKLLVLTAAAAIVGASAFGALAAPASEDACFLTRDLRGHTIGTDGHTLYFDVNGTAVYQVTTTNNCLANVTGSDTLILRDRGLGKICHPLDLDTRARGTQCLVANMSRLSAAEAQALPKRLRP